MVRNQGDQVLYKQYTVKEQTSASKSKITQPMTFNLKWFFEANQSSRVAMEMI